MTFFEQELRKIVGDEYPDATFVGRACYVRLSAGISGSGTIIGELATEIISTLSDLETLSDMTPDSYFGFSSITSPIMLLFCIILMAYAVIKVFFANLKRGGILLIQIAMGSLFDGIGGFPAAGFSAGQGSKAGGIGYQEECAPTLKAADSGTNMVPSILCLNDHGGSAMDCSLDVTGALRAQEHGHQPLIYENHGVDAHYTGPLKVAPTMSARYGTGGNNVPLVEQESV